MKRTIECDPNYISSVRNHKQIVLSNIPKNCECSAEIVEFLNDLAKRIAKFAILTRYNGGDRLTNSYSRGYFYIPSYKAHDGDKRLWKTKKEYYQFLVNEWAWHFMEWHVLDLDSNAFYTQIAPDWRKIKCIETVGYCCSG